MVLIIFVNSDRSQLAFSNKLIIDCIHNLKLLDINSVTENMVQIFIEPQDQNIGRKSSLLYLEKQFSYGNVMKESSEYLLESDPREGAP